MAYAGLFLTAFLAATILPLASELPLVLIVRDSGQIVWPVVVATCGNYLGACTTYLLARAAVAGLARRSRGDGGSARQAASTTTPRALRVVRRYGAPALLLSWVPVVGDAIVAAAGATGVAFSWFSLWTVLGKAGRYVLVAWTVRP